MSWMMKWIWLIDVGNLDICNFYVKGVLIKLEISLVGVYRCCEYSGLNILRFGCKFIMVERKLNLNWGIYEYDVFVEGLFM